MGAVVEKGKIVIQNGVGERTARGAIVAAPPRKVVSVEIAADDDIFFRGKTQEELTPFRGSS